MNIRAFDKTNDYELISKWWNSHNHAILPIDMIPVGVIIEKDSTPLCASFLYDLAGTNTSMILWTVSNKNINKREIHKAITLATDTLVNYAKATGKEYIMSFVKSKGLTKIYNKKGFITGEPHNFLMGGL